MIYYIVFGQYPFQMSRKLREMYMSKTYEEKILIAPESLAYTGNTTTMTLLLRFTLRCLSADENVRPEPNWSVIVLR